MPCGGFEVDRLVLMKLGSDRGKDARPMSFHMSTWYSTPRRKPCNVPRKSVVILRFSIGSRDGRFCGRYAHFDVRAKFDAKTPGRARGMFFASHENHPHLCPSCRVAAA